jgi:hypothetical protein
MHPARQPLQGVNEPRYLIREPDAEAARYPQLFRHRLAAERPDWRERAQLLPAPGEARGPGKGAGGRLAVGVGGASG